MAYLSNTSVNGDLGVSGLTSVGSAGLKFTSGIINIFGTFNSGGTGINSISIGGKAAATGEAGIALGYNAGSNATDTISIGRSSKANNTSSIAIGCGATDSNSYGIAIGDSAHSYKDYGVAIGYGAKSSGINAIAIGGSSIDVTYQTTASGTNSIAIGPYYTQATGTKGVAIGYGSKTSAGTVINYNGTYSNGIRIGYYNTSGTNYYISWSGSSNGTISTSDRRDKFNIEEINIDKALEFITKIKPVTYNYNYREEYLTDPDKKNTLEYDEVEHQKGTKKNNRRSSGVIAQDVYSLEKEVFNDDNFAAIVDYNKYYSKDDAPDELDRYYVRYEQFIPFLIASIKKLNIEIESLKNEIEKIKNNRE